MGRLMLLMLVAAGAVAGELQDYAERCAQGAARTVERARTRTQELGVRDVFGSAYWLCAARHDLAELDQLLDTAAEMQDRTPASDTYGNYRWYMRDGVVMDRNAVDFCMQWAIRIVRDHSAQLSAAQRQKLDQLMRLSVIGCQKHRVRDSYTNIALMNAVNLVLLGEIYQPGGEVCAEGVKRLDAFMLNTAVSGICEYASPTYAAVDLETLHFFHHYVRDAKCREKCERLLKLFWLDFAATAFPGAGRFAGAHSRDYDYLHGIGGARNWLMAAGIVQGGERDRVPFEFLTDDWRPDAATCAIAARSSRRVQSRWGDEPEQFRSLWVGRNVALGVAGARYGSRSSMDIPLAVDFAGPVSLARGYFIADARRDPYGRKKIPEFKGPHRKCYHLAPFWMGTQRGRDALGLAVYPDDCVPEDSPTLESHFVFPSVQGGIYCGERRLEGPTKGRPFTRELADGEPVFVRVGAGAMGVKVAWARDVAGARAKCAVVWDDTPGVDACRLTVAHHDGWRSVRWGGEPAVAVLWVRVCDDAADEGRFAEFRRSFAAAGCKVELKERQTALDVCAQGEEGELRLATGRNLMGVAKVVPLPKGGVLSVDGRDVGAAALGEVAGLKEYREMMARSEKALRQNRVPVNGRGDVEWEAEEGAVRPNMVVGEDRRASGGRFVWAPGAPGAGGGGPGMVTWHLDVLEAGEYRLWGRVMAPTPSDDSFFVSLREGDPARMNLRMRAAERMEWGTGVTGGEWKWVEFRRPLKLRRGSYALSLHVREDGTKIDRLRLER